MRACFVLAHICSQIFRKNIVMEQFENNIFVGDDNDHFELWNRNDWVEFIRHFCQQDGGSNSALVQILLNCSISTHEIASVIYSQIEACKAHNCRYLLFCDEEYPKLLRQIIVPPLGLFARGRISVLNSNMISVIGSRRASSRALSRSHDLGKLLVDQSLAIVSGGAFGCDVAVHLGGMESSEKTKNLIIVFANSLDRIGPKSNHHVFQRLLSSGGLFLSERLWSSKTYPYHFPTRNRIISGLSPITVVMEAGLKSGTLLTCNLALDQGRDVLVSFSESYGVGSDGGASLVADGAQGFADVKSLAKYCQDYYESLA